MDTVQELHFKVHIKNQDEEKCYLSDFNCSRIVDAREAGLSLYETADL